MTEYAGSAVLLKTGTWSGGTIVAGFRTNDISINNAVIDVSSKDSQFRKLLTGGIKSCTISGNGIVSDAASFETLLGYFTAASSNALALGGIGNSFTIEANFIVTSATLTGEYLGEQTFSFTAESVGTVTYTQA